MASQPNGPGIGPQMSIIQGQQQQTAYDAEAASLGQESTDAYKFGLEERAQNDYKVASQKAHQNAQFGQSGVELSGSPLGILGETQALGDQVSRMIMERATAQSDLYSEQGLQMLRSGSAAAFGGQAKAIDMTYQYQLQKAQNTNSAWGSILDGGINLGMQFANMI